MNFHPTSSRWPAALYFSLLSFLVLTIIIPFLPSWRVVLPPLLAMNINRLKLSILMIL
jgi:hypothetical protein